MLLHNPSDPCTNVIYADPCCPSTRSIIGSVTPALWAFVCTGGATTLSQCGQEVFNTSAQLCSGGCTNNLSVSRSLMATTDPCQPGDSGGAIYQRSGDTGALAAGLHIAGADNVFGYHICWFHTVAQVQSHFGVSLVTTP
jgi:hypothetical protein